MCVLCLSIPFGGDAGGGVNFTHRWPLNVSEKAACSSVDPDHRQHFISVYTPDTRTHTEYIHFHWGYWKSDSIRHSQINRASRKSIANQLIRDERKQADRENRKLSHVTCLSLACQVKFLFSYHNSLLLNNTFDCRDVDYINVVILAVSTNQLFVKLDILSCFLKIMV